MKEERRKKQGETSLDVLDVIDRSTLQHERRGPIVEGEKIEYQEGCG